MPLPPATVALASPAWGGLALLLGAGLAAYLAFLTGLTLRRLRNPPRRTYAWALANGRPGDPSELPGAARAFEAWSFRRGGLDLPVWEIRGDDPAGPIVVCTHGWAGSRVEMLARVPALAACSSRVVLWDMPGHGEAGGACTLGGREARDLVGLVETIGEPVVLHGFSLGARVSVEAARLTGARVRGLILEAASPTPFTPAWNMLGAIAFPRLVNLPLALALNGLVSGRGAGSAWRDLGGGGPIGVPTLVLHGDRDELTPAGQAERLAAALGAACVVVPGAGHADLFDHAAAREAAAGFLRESRGAVSGA